MTLSRYEQETILLFNEEEQTGTVFTYNVRLQNRLKRMAEKYPDDCHFEWENNEGGVSYQVSKNMICVRAPFGSDRKRKLREQALAEKRRPPIR